MSKKSRTCGTVEDRRGSQFPHHERNFPDGERRPELCLSARKQGRKRRKVRNKGPEVGRKRRRRRGSVVKGKKRRNAKLLFGAIKGLCRW